MKYATLSIAIVLVLTGVTATTTHAAAGFTHVNCSGAESPVIQNAIHADHISSGECDNTAEGYDPYGTGHPQLCLVQYGGGRYAEVDCSSGSNCIGTGYISCSPGNYTSVRLECPPGPGGIPVAVTSNAAGVKCEYVGIGGNNISLSCGCDSFADCN